MNLDSEHRKQDQVWIIRVDGEVDLYSSPAMRQELKKAIKAKVKAVLIDLSAVDYMDSSGVATLIEALQALKKSKNRLALVGAAQPVMQVLKFAKLDQVFDLFDTIEEAITG